ncbi:MAG: hypothetical protein U9O41_07915 [Candidatus Aerophobetes bacterium]|nr:hypothetical protein [Candidatus Aerophobetes bacterium]
MVIERIVGPYGYVIFDIWKTDYFQNIPDEEEKNTKSLQKEEKGQKEESSRFH